MAVLPVAMSAGAPAPLGIFQRSGWTTRSGSGGSIETASSGKRLWPFSVPSWTTDGCYTKSCPVAHSRWLTSVRTTRQRHTLLRPEEENFTARGCAQVYRDITQAFEPRSDELDAVAYWPGYGRLRSRYRRLMLPFRASERTWLASGICLDPGIDLLD